MNKSTPHLFQLGDWRADANQNLLWQDQKQVHLEPKAMAILHYLVLHANEVISRETLFAEFWAKQVVTEDALNRAMWNIRKTLGDSSNCPQYIATVRNQGYKLVAPVTFLKDPRIEQHQALLKAAQDNQNINGKTQNAPLSQQWLFSNKKRWYVSITILIFFVLVILVINWLGIINKGNKPVELKRLTYDLAQNIMPSYSPDAKDLVYIAKSNNKMNKLMYRESTKTYAYQLGNRQSNYSYPTYGGNNHSLAVIAENTKNTSLSVINLTTKVIDNVLTLTQPSAGLTWHPNQNLLAYSQPHPLNHKPVIYTVHSQLKQPRVLTDTGSGLKDVHPKFSPLGTHIAFIRQFSYQQEGIFIVNLKGQTQPIGINHNKIISFTWLDKNTLLLSLKNGLFTLSLSGELTPLYSEQTAYISHHLNYNQLSNQLTFNQIKNSSQIVNFTFTKNKNKKSQVITQSQANDSEGVVSRNGRNLAFVSDRSGQIQIWLRRGNLNNYIEGSEADVIYDLRWSDNSHKLAAISKSNNKYFLLLYDIVKQKLSKHLLGKTAINLIDWQSSNQLLFSQQDTKNWSLYQYDINLNQKNKFHEINSIQGRLTPDKRQLIFTKQQDSAVWLWNFNDAAHMIKNSKKLALSRNWFVDDEFLYYFIKDGNKKQSQLWQLSLQNGQQQQVRRYPELDTNHRAQKLIYTFAATQHQIISGDIWAMTLN